MNKQKLLKYLPFILGIVIIAVGAFFRFDEALHTDSWYDEAFTGITVRQSWPDFIAVIIQDRNHPPLFYSLVKIVTTLVGSTDPFQLRLVSLFFGIATIPLGYLLVQQLNLSDKEKQWFGLSVMTVLSLSPFFISYSAEARSYAFLLFLMLLSITLFIRAAKKSFRFTWELFGLIFMMVMIMLTHYLSILIVSGFIVAFIFLKLEEKKLLYNGDFMKRVGITTALGWVVFTWAWQYFALNKLIEKLNLGWIPKTDLSAIPKTIVSFLFGVNRQELGFPTTNSFSFPLFAGNLGFVILIASVIVFVLVVQQNLKNREKMRDIVILGAMGIVPLAADLLASSLGLHMYVDRYVIGYGTALIIFFMYLWWSVSQKNFIAIIAAYVVLLCFVVRPVHSTKYSQVLDVLPRDSAITVESPIDYLVLSYYLPDRGAMVLRDTSGNSYNWPYIPPAVEVEQDKVSFESTVLMGKWSNRKIPSTWVKQFETSDFVGYKVN